MPVTRAMHMARVRRMEAEGWTQADYYPAAGVSIMVRGEQVITVMKNGKLKAGVHPPEN